MQKQCGDVHLIFSEGKALREIQLFEQWKEHGKNGTKTTALTEPLCS